MSLWKCGDKRFPIGRFVEWGKEDAGIRTDFAFPVGGEVARQCASPAGVVVPPGKRRRVTRSTEIGPWRSVSCNAKVAACSTLMGGTKGSWNEWHCRPFFAE